MNINYLKNKILLIAVIVAFAFPVAFASAETKTPMIATHSASQLSNDSFRLSAIYDASGSNYVPAMQEPSVWFEYGNDMNLESTTRLIRISKTTKNIAVDIDNLNKGLKYYYRVLMIFNGELTQGNIKSITLSSNFGSDTTSDSNNYVNNTNTLNNPIINNSNTYNTDESNDKSEGKIVYKYNTSNTVSKFSGSSQEDERTIERFDYSDSRGFNDEYNSRNSDADFGDYNYNTSDSRGFNDNGDFAYDGYNNRGFYTASAFSAGSTYVNFWPVTFWGWLLVILIILIIVFSIAWYLRRKRRKRDLEEMRYKNDEKVYL